MTHDGEDGQSQITRTCLSCFKAILDLLNDALGQEEVRRSSPLEAHLFFCERDNVMRHLASALGTVTHFSHAVL